MEIKTIRKVQQVFITAEINGAQVNINYDFADTPPTQINMYANYNGNGVSSTCNRSYNAEGVYSPISENIVYPFNASFNTSLAGIVTAIYANPAEPVFYG